MLEETGDHLQVAGGPFTLQLDWQTALVEHYLTETPLVSPLGHCATPTTLCTCTYMEAVNFLCMQ